MSHKLIKMRLVKSFLAPFHLLDDWVFQWHSRFYSQQLMDPSFVQSFKKSKKERKVKACLDISFANDNVNLNAIVSTERKTFFILRSMNTADKTSVKTCFLSSTDYHWGPSHGLARICWICVRIGGLYRREGSWVRVWTKGREKR